MNKISELQPKQGNVNLTADVTEISEPRTFSKFGNEGRVANAKIRDSSGEMTLTLWNDQVDQVKPNSRVTIKNGYVSEWQGELQISTGKFGTLEVGSSEEPQENSEKKETAEKVTEERIG